MFKLSGKHAIVPRYYARYLDNCSRRNNYRAADCFTPGSLLFGKEKLKLLQDFHYFMLLMLGAFKSKPSVLTSLQSLKLNRSYLIKSYEGR